MSDISLNIHWYDLLLAAPIIGWPGLIVGAILGALLWKKRRIAGALIGALLCSLAWMLARIYFK